MKVSDLAEELEVPASTVLDQCQRFGIDASWAGAELSGADVVVLRAELASGAPIDLTPADPIADSVDEPVAVAAGAAPASAPGAVPPDVGEASAPDPAPVEAATSTPASLPPTAVGSLPELADEITPNPEPVAADPRLPGRPPTVPAVPGTPEAPRSVAPRTPPAKRRFDSAARTSVIALVVAAAAFAASNVVDLPVFVALLWFVTGVSLIVAVVDAFRGRRHALIHPDRLRGVWMATVALVVAVAGIIGLTTAVLAVTADDPADAPVDLSDLSSVHVARWGYQRTALLADNGWRQPARDDGTCWRAEPRRDERNENRVEATKVNTSDACGSAHTLEVAKVFAFDREADSPYPGADKILIAAQEECAEVFEEIQSKVPGVAVDVEYPTEVGWSEADHDVACTASVPKERTGRFAS